MPWKGFIRAFLRRRRRGEINPDEIFIDASNLPQFDEHQFEGRMEKPLSKRTFFYIGAVIVLVMAVFTWRLFTLQVVKGGTYADVSEDNRLDHSLIFANRGVIYDRNRTPLAWNEPNEDESYAVRVYASESGLAHLLGYIGYPQKDSSGNYYQTSLVGKDGMEREKDALLGGENGLKIVETDALGEVRSESIIRPPENGRDLYLSVDERVTRELHRLLKERSEESGFAGGAGIIMNVKNGEVLAISNFPEYDPNALSSGGIDAIQEYIANERKPFLNRAVSGLYTPGSIVKPFVAAGALDAGIITPEKEIVSTGSISIPNPYFPDQVNIFRDWKAHGAVDMRQAIAVSSDVYFYEIGGGYEGQAGLGIDRLKSYLTLFGFGEPTGVSFTGEAHGVIPDPAWKERTFEDGTWRVGDTYHTVIGQYGLLATPLQAVRATASLANGGILLTPTFVRGEKTTSSKLPISDEYLNVAREGMRMAVTEGTASGLSMPEVVVAAKTGTAELGVTKKFVNSWVIGFFPYDNPRYAFAVLMERGPEENLIGGLYVMRRLLEWMSVNTPEYLSS